MQVGADLVAVDAEPAQRADDAGRAAGMVLFREPDAHPADERVAAFCDLLQREGVHLHRMTEGVAGGDDRHAGDDTGRAIDPAAGDLEIGNGLWLHFVDGGGVNLSDSDSGFSLLEFWASLGGFIKPTSTAKSYSSGIIIFFALPP